MNAAETAELLGLAAAFDRRTVGRADVLAWQTVLADITLAAAKAAVTQHYASETRWIMPADIRNAVTTARAQADTEHQGPGLSAEVPDADPDDPAAYLAAVRAQRTRAAEGRRPRPVASLTARMGRALPTGDPAPVDGADSVRRPGPLGVACPQCRAAIGQPCKAPAIDGRPPRQRGPHVARRAAADGRATDSAAARTDEEARRAVYLRQLEQMQETTG